MTAGGRARRAGLAVVLLLAVGLAAGCSDSRSSSGPTVPSDTGVIRLVPPTSCGSVQCASFLLSNVQISGPLSLGPFNLGFFGPSTVPFAPPGAYTVSGATFQSSANETRGCPAAGFTVATARTTTVTFTINDDVCSVAAVGPA